MRSGAADLGAMKGLEQVEKAEIYVLHFESQRAKRGSRRHGGVPRIGVKNLNKSQGEKKGLEFTMVMPPSR